MISGRAASSPLRPGSPANPSPAQRIATCLIATRLIAACLAAALFLGCAGAPNYSTAKMLPEGRLQAGPRITSFATFAPERYKIVSNRHFYSLGGNLAYGLTNEINLAAGFDRTILGDEDDYLFDLDVKLGQDRIHEAMSIGYGFYYLNRIHQINIAGYTNWYFNKRIYYCLSPGISFVHVFPGGGEDRGLNALNAVVSNSLTFEFYERVHIRPMVGLNVMGLLVRMAIFNYGVAGGLAF